MPRAAPEERGCIDSCFQQIDALLTADECQYQRGYIESGQGNDTDESGDLF